jgi:hypothetical protein
MAVEPTSAASIDPLPGKCGFFSQRLKRLCRGDAVEGMPMCALHLQYASAEVAACAEAVRGAFGEHMHVCKHSISFTICCSRLALSGIFGRATALRVPSTHARSSFFSFSARPSSESVCALS